MAFLIIAILKMTKQQLDSSDGNILDSLRMIHREEQQLTKSNSNHDYIESTRQDKQ
jgi:hypothetical protein